MRFTLTVHVNDNLINKLQFALKCSKAEAKQLIKGAVESNCNTIQRQELCIWDKDERFVDFSEPSDVTGCEIIEGASAAVWLTENQRRKRP
jgi:hypothetical protein